MSLIREYRSEDAAQLEECFVELQEFERPFDPYLADGRTIAKKYLGYMFTRCAETSGKVFVAEADGAVAGFVSVWAKVKSTAVEEKDYEYAYISDLVVLARYRGRGLGRALLQKAEDYAKLQGASLLKIGVLARNEVVRNLYIDHGFEEFVVALIKKLAV